jgi:hypothetical protein
MNGTNTGRSRNRCEGFSGTRFGCPHAALTARISAPTLPAGRRLFTPARDARPRYFPANSERRLLEVLSRRGDQTRAVDRTLTARKCFDNLAVLVPRFALVGNNRKLRYVGHVASETDGLVPSTPRQLGDAADGDCPQCAHFRVSNGPRP